MGDSSTKIRFTIATIILAGGVATLGSVSTTWIAVTLAVYALPLFCQFIPIRWLNLAGLWWGLFLVAQTLISPWVPGLNYLTLPENFSRVIDVRDGIPGISGIQSITTDARGFRTSGIVDYDDAKPFRIFAIGGSTTEEIFLDDTKTWTSQLQENLNAIRQDNVEVINTGLSGLRSGNHLATLKKILHLNPDAAVFMLGANDWNHQIRRDNASLAQRLISNHTEPFWLSNTMLGKMLRIYKLQSGSADAGQTQQTNIIDGQGQRHMINRGSLQKRDQRNYEVSSISTTYINNLNAIGEVCRNNNIDCVFVTQPNGYSAEASSAYINSFWMTPPDEDYTLDLASLEKVAKTYNSHLVSFGQQDGHTVCDLAAEFEPSFDSFYDDFHFNEAGSTLVAARLAACLTDL